MNSAVLIGRITKDPELQHTEKNNKPFCSFILAVDRPRKNGEDMGADFIRVIVWEKQAENLVQYVQKGRQLGVSGSIRTGSYTNKDGIKVYTTDIFASRIEYLGDSHKTDAPPANMPVPDFDDLPESFIPDSDEDIPF